MECGTFGELPQSPTVSYMCANLITVFDSTTDPRQTVAQIIVKFEQKCQAQQINLGIRIGYLFRQ